MAKSDKKAHSDSCNFAVEISSRICYYNVVGLLKGNEDC